MKLMMLYNMSRRSIIRFLAVLVIIGWGLSGLLYIKVTSLRNKLHTYEIEKRQLQEAISELKKRRLENVTIRIGVTAASDYDYNRMKRFFEEIIEKDVNEYCAKLGYDIVFKFIIKNNKERAGIAIQNLQAFKEMGINIIIGHPWSSHNYVSMTYVNENNMLLFSPSSSSSQLARPGDNLLRMSPDDMAQASIIAEMLRSWGIKAIIIFHTPSDYGIGLYNALEDEFTKRGGVILKRILLREPWGPNITSYLDEAEVAAREAVARYGSEHVAVQLIGGSEFVRIVKQARNYPILFSLYWFGSHYAAKNKAFIEECPEESSHLKIFSPLPAPTESPLYSSLNERYYTLFSEQLDFDMACTYDVAWIIVRSILEAQTTDIDQLLEVIPAVASMTFGASGWCKLNEAGDRYSANYEIWGYGYVDGEVKYIKYGLYDSMTDEVSWYTETLGFTPPGSGN